MTEIPIDPELRAAVLKELRSAQGTAEELADDILRAINRALYVRSVQRIAADFAQQSRERVRTRKSDELRTAFAKSMERCCCAWADGVEPVGIPTYPCRKCLIHSHSTTSRLTCFEHRKQERNGK